MRIGRGALLGGVAAATMAAAVSAHPVRYEFAGIGSGALGGEAFDDRPFEIVVAADTSDVLGDFAVFAVVGTASIDIEGYAAASFIGPQAIFTEHVIASVSFRHGLYGPKLLELVDQSLAHYQLEAPFGPVGATPAAVVGPFQDILTSLGPLTISAVDQLVFRAAYDCDHDGQPDNGVGIDCNGNGDPDLCDIAHDPTADCNGNGILDLCEMTGDVPDLNGDGVPDECNCLADFSGDGEVGVTDFLIVLVTWGTCEPGCSGDADFDGTVGVLDVLAVLGTWGPCG